ncbi:MAG: hypothetical protein ABIF40_05790 [archaeon]
MMINTKEFTQIRKELKDLEQKREATIQKAREIIRISKLIIYALHRNDVKAAKKHITKIKQKIKILPINNYDTGIRKVAIQEYVEAMTLYYFITEKRLISKKELKVNTEDYLLGLCDLTGEVVRLGVNSVIKRNSQIALECKELVEDIYGEFLLLDLRNGELRKKSDSIKWNLRKLEDLAVDISRKRNK